MFTVSPLDVLHVPEGRLLLQTLRSHDQFNTTIYGLDDRYRGIRAAAAWCSCTRSTSPSSASSPARSSTWSASGPTAPSGRAAAFRVVPYDQPRGCAAAYYPETNALVPLDSTAIGSNCPTSKSVIVRLDPNGHGAAGSTGHGGERGQDEGHKCTGRAESHLASRPPQR